MPTTEVTTLSLESIGRFHDWLSVRGSSEQTVKAYCSDLRMLLRDTDRESIPMVEFQLIALQWLTRYRKIVAFKTTNRRLTSLKRFAKWAGWGEPLAEFDPPTNPPGQPHPIPEGMDGVRRMMECATRDNHRALIGLCGMAGLRVHEALIARASQFDLHDMMLTVVGKGEKERLVPVSEELWRYIGPAVVDSFVNEDAPIVSMHDRAARKVVTRLGVEAKLQRHVKSHDLRATFATELYNKVLDINLVRIILGHASVETTQIYTGTSKRAMRDAVAQI